jgi:hypothetical protein
VKPSSEVAESIAAEAKVLAARLKAAEDGQPTYSKADLTQAIEARMGRERRRRAALEAEVETLAAECERLQKLLAAT